MRNHFPHNRIRHFDPSKLHEVVIARVTLLGQAVTAAEMLSAAMNRRIVRSALVLSAMWVSNRTIACHGKREGAIMT